jgi:hypothetical protein
MQSYEVQKVLVSKIEKDKKSPRQKSKKRDKSKSITKIIIVKA